MSTALDQFVAPRPLGANWEAFHGISAYGVLRRAWRINQLHRSELRSVLGITVTSQEDVFHKSLRSNVLKDRLARLYPDVQREDWEWAAWWPFDGAFPTAAFTPVLRECPSCARTCYHSLLFQMPGMTHCPWHGDALIERCPRCDRRLQAGLREHLPPGRCPCGYDLVEETATVLGDKALRSRRSTIGLYHQWAAFYRKYHWLIAPEAPDPEADAALRALAGPDLEIVFPNQSRPRHADVILETIPQPPWTERPQLRENSGLEQFKPTTACLPVGWYPSMRKIAEAVVAMMPPQARRDSMRPKSELRSLLDQLPACPVGPSVFLQTECLDRVVLRCLGRLAAALRRAPPGTRRFPEADGLTARLEPVWTLGSVLVERVLKRILLRGYADGARIAIGRHVPELYDPDKPRPVRRYPWVVLNLSEWEAQIAWTRQPGTV